MKRLLIANRGEIARRYADAAAALGVETVGLFAEDEAADGALAARRLGADRMAPLAGAGARAYLDQQAVLGVAAREACDAVAVGYGFLSENAAFADAVTAAGRIFVGPSAALLRKFGDKQQARRAAEAKGLPITPGLIAEPDAGPDPFIAFLETQGGAPIMLKARAGGGGRGMRVVRAASELPTALGACRNEAEAAFGDGAVYAERLIEGARHIEVQIAGDAAGAVTHLWDRDCTVQRRRQKLIEIAPALGLPRPLRAALRDAAERLLGGEGYQGLATVEFLTAPDESFYFLEVNPRIQVEHTVTEEILGLDLVTAQLRLARGERLDEIDLVDAEGRPPPVRGAAIQLRVNAEAVQPDGALRPAKGRVERVAAPSGPGMRFDSAAYAGMKPSPLYDPLLGKLIIRTLTEDRAALFAAARRALRALTLEGVESNRHLLAALLARPEIAAGDDHTAFVETHLAALLEAAALEAPEGAEEAEEASTVRPAAANCDPIADGAEPLAAPLAAVVRSLDVAPGDEIAVGQTVALLEALKMEHPLVSTAAGRVAAIAAPVGAFVEEGAPVLFLSDVIDRGDAAVAEAEPDPAFVRPDLAAVVARHARVMDEARPEAVKKRRDRGRWTARENIAALVDPGSFAEIGALAVAAQRSTRPMEELIEKSPADAIITGFGAINGARFGAAAARCGVYAVDYTAMAGTQGLMHHNKMDRLFELATRAKRPLVIFPEGGGGRPTDTDMIHLSAGWLNVPTFAMYTALEGVVPRIAVVSGYCFAGNALFAGASDIVIATDDACIGMAGPAMIEAGGLGRHRPEEIGPAATQLAIGGVDQVVESEAEAIPMARRALSYFQGDEPQWSAADQRRLRHVVPENRRRPYDMRKLIELLADDGSVLELQAGTAPGVITALIRIEGRPFALMANNPRHLGGALDPEGCDKGARLLRLADAHGLPVISICDTPGYMVGPAIEAEGQAKRGVALMTASAQLKTPLLCLVTRKAYGIGAQAMAGGGFSEPDLAIAWPSAEFGPMGLEGAVRLAAGKELAAIADEGRREARFQELVDALYERGGAMNAASLLEIDAVIDPMETRGWLLKGLAAATTR